MNVVAHPTATASRAEAPRLIEQMRRAIRVRHYSLRTEEAYLGWVRRFFAYTRRHPRELASDDVNRFLTPRSTVVGEECPEVHCFQMDLEGAQRV
jgi:hypothetical protein